MYSLRKLLWLDCTAAALAGVLVLVFSGWLSRLHVLPRELLVFTGVMNLLYASYSFSLARSPHRPMLLIKLLVYANAAWVLVCLGLAASFWERASVFGIGHLIGEAFFVGGLAVQEWRQRDLLATATGETRAL